MKEEIKELVQFATTDKTPKNRVLQLGKLLTPEVKLIQAKTGIDLTGYSRVLDKSGINHTLKLHGNVKTEAARGQIAVTNEDFELIPEIVKSENVIYSGKNKIGNDCILYEAYIDNLIFYIEEIRQGRKQLCIQTMYKRKKPTKSWF